MAEAFLRWCIVITEVNMRVSRSENGWWSGVVSKVMSRKANCWDNAVTASFFGILKTELIHHERFRTRQEAKDKLFDYIEVFYNRSRIHSATEYFAPAKYEARYNEAQMKQPA